jgi:hypothetical protein
VTCDQGCAPPHHTVRRHRSIIETHICRERYCVKLLGVGRGDAVAAWPSQDRTPLNEPFERLVSDHRRPDTLYVLPSDSVLLYKDPPCEPKSDLTNQNQQFRNRQTNTRPIFSPLLGRLTTTHAHGAAHEWWERTSRRALVTATHGVLAGPATSRCTASFTHQHTLPGQCRSSGTLRKPQVRGEWLEPERESMWRAERSRSAWCCWSFSYTHTHFPPTTHAHPPTHTLVRTALLPPFSTLSASTAYSTLRSSVCLHRIYTRIQLTLFPASTLGPHTHPLSSIGRSEQHFSRPATWPAPSLYPRSEL